MITFENPFIEAAVNIPLMMFTPIFLFLLFKYLRKKHFQHQMSRIDLTKEQWKYYFRRCIWNYMGMVPSNCLVNNRWEEAKGKLSPAQAAFDEFE